MLLMSVLQYSINVRIVNSIIILGLNCKPLIASNVSKLKYKTIDKSPSFKKAQYALP